MVETKLVLAENAQKLLENDEFVDDWKQLARSISEFTSLQEFEFVSSWFENHKEFDPVLSTGYNGEGKLIGLMCLAWHIKERYIVHAGNFDAEYHGWLATPSITPIFLDNTVQLIKDQFPIKKWKWSWMPPGFSSHHFDAIDKNGIAAILEKRPAPVWDLTDPAKLRSLQKSRSLKSKFNRYKKRGDYRFEIITDPKRTTEILNIVSLQCDLRQYAINNALPFEKNPNKIPFCTALQTCPGLVHVSAMWLDDQLLAFHLGIIDNKRVCLGLTSYDPSESRQSPGTLLLIELANSLTEQGYETLDLTPGRDLYKDRFANDFQNLSRPTITFTTKAKYFEKTKYFAISTILRLLPLFKIEIHSILNWKRSILEFTDFLRVWGIKGMFQGLGKKVFSKKTIYVYFVENMNPDRESPSRFVTQQQHYESLMKYNRQIPFLTKRRFLQESLEKFSNGETLFSAIQKEQLGWLGWLSDIKNPVKFRGVSQSLSIEKGSHILYDFCCQKSIHHSGDFFNYLKSVLNQLDLTDFSGLNICLEATFQLSEDQISSLGVSSMKKIDFIKIGHFFKKVHVNESVDTLKKYSNSTD